MLTRDGRRELGRKSASTNVARCSLIALLVSVTGSSYPTMYPSPSRNRSSSKDGDTPCSDSNVA